MEVIVTKDGANLAYEQWGGPAGFPVFSLHGTPGCRLNRHPDNEAIAAAGARLITYGRPGYGQSTRRPGSRIVGCASDVAAIADAAAIGRFAVTGGSGGGPHALAVAARLPERVVRARCVSVLASPDKVIGLLRTLVRMGQHSAKPANEGHGRRERSN